MNNDVMKNLVWLHDKPQSTGLIKQSADDFFVAEDLGYEPDGEGEHLLVRVRKTGCNTQFVVEQLAKFAGIPARSVSYAGLKDRHAVTEQWFCLHMPGKSDPDMDKFQLEGCQIIRFARHKRKLRISNLKGNSFRLVLRHINDRSAVEPRLDKIAKAGVPNYFGEQRFGRNGNNLIQAKRWASGEIRVKERQKRSFYLSAVRSALFNYIASARISQHIEKQVLFGDAIQLTGKGSWFVAQQDELDQIQHRLDDGDVQITAPLPGDNALGSQSEALVFEQRLLEPYPEFMGLLRQERLESSRRAVIVRPQQFIWQWMDENTLQLNFSLPAGSFATSIVREIIQPGSEQFIDILD